MYRKIKLRRLLLVAGILILAVAALTLKDYFKADRSFRKFVLEIDTAKISSISISAGVPVSTNIKIYSDNLQWKVSDSEHTYTADPGIIKNILSELVSLKIESLAGNSKANWTEFEVTDSAAIRVSIVEKDKKEATSLFIGKFSYQKPENQYERQGKLHSYVRVAGEDETFSIQGFLRMNFVPMVNNYRNRYLTKTSSESFNKVSFTYPGDSSFVLLRNDKKWTLNGMPVDSVRQDGYFTELEHLSSSEFADTVKHASLPVFVVKIEGSELPSAIEIKAFKKDFTVGYIINSSFNSEASFNGSAQNLFSKIFKGKNAFLK